MTKPKPPKSEKMWAVYYDDGMRCSLPFFYTKSDAIEDFMGNGNIYSWRHYHNQGYRCLEVEIRPVKARKK